MKKETRISQIYWEAKMKDLAKNQEVLNEKYNQIKKNLNFVLKRTFFPLKKNEQRNNDQRSRLRSVE